ncbi:MAG TPA: SPOR domain-containing protein [Ramlibacter sp.]|jgi:DedD protein|nr:SPOR domain-containing protein [Ramlibacter sp.]
MALFKTRKGGDEPQATHRQPESVEAIRTRARHRLIGAGVLVLIAIIGFPVLFDTQPRPVAVDIPIQIPDRNKARPLAAPAVSGPVTAASTPAKVAAVASPAPAPAPQADAAPEPKPQIKNESKAEVKSAAAAKPEPKPDEGNKARALLEGKSVQVAAASDSGRYVVQVGAFADAAKAREARMKVERAGLKTYTQVAETSDGKRTRVRVGPFGTRAEADKAAGKIKGLDLPASILSL